MKELWKIIEFATNYEVSNNGRIRNRTTKKVLKPFSHKLHPSTLRVTLIRHGINEKHTISQIVYNHWCRQENENPTYYYKNDWKVKNNRIGHRDGNIMNNNFENLYRY